ncbi:MAG: SagB/ThcOx family dehydrogenase [Desulfomonilaceae bacterium]
MIKSACDYHDLTSYHRYKTGGHALDWFNQPNTFKIYEGLERLQLEETSDWPEECLSELLTVKQYKTSKQITLRDLGRILRLSHCLTHKQKAGGNYFYFRNVASAGALYPAEIYFASVNVLGLNQGIYHHSVADQSIISLKKGSYQDALAREVHFQCEESPCLYFFLTAIFFRSSWKYRDRAFRYHLLDTGHLAENLLLALRATRLNFAISYDFNDSAINELLAVDPKKEACLAAVKVFSNDTVGESPRSTVEQPPANLKRFSACASEEKLDPVIRAAYDITSASGDSGGNDSRHGSDWFSNDRSQIVQLEPVGKPPQAVNYVQALLNRRSRRNFVRQTIPGTTFSWLISCFGEQASFGNDRLLWRNFLTVGVMVADVHGIPPGFYIVEPDEGSLSLIRRGSFTEEMAHICLDQLWLSNCSCHFLFLANLEFLETEYGPRSYRRVMLETGRLGQRLYLAAETVRFGCCGIGAFYDEEAFKFLNLGPGFRLLYVVACGPLTKAFV